MKEKCGKSKPGIMRGLVLMVIWLNLYGYVFI